MRMAFVASIVKRQMPKTPESNLLFAILEQATKDVFDESQHRTNHRSAKEFFNGNMECVAMVGINPDWVRTLLKKAKLLEIVNE